MVMGGGRADSREKGASGEPAGSILYRLRLGLSLPSKESAINTASYAGRE